jgi:YbgC/YbaW family acyl-CoA thioester hydrolase
MPYVHTETFRVRHYECDRYGEVHAANYLRYMQEAAFGASEAVGFPPERYESLGLQWLAYETDIVHNAPLHYGDTLTIRTWVQDFRRVRSLRIYELNRDDQMIARASTDWVLLDTETRRPMSVTQEIIDAYAQGEAVDTAPPRRPLPPARIPEHGLFTISRHARWHEIDRAQHVNNAVFLEYALDCEMQAMTYYEWPVEMLREHGLALALRRHQIEYKQAALLDDELAISSWIAVIDTTTVFRHFVIRRVSDDVLLARIRSLRELVDAESGVPRPFPGAYRDDFALNTRS